MLVLAILIIITALLTTGGGGFGTFFVLFIGGCIWLSIGLLWLVIEKILS